MVQALTPDELRLRLDELRLRDPRLQLFGARTHRYVLNPCIDRDELERVEARLGTTIPEDYRQFLLTCGDGGAGPDYGLLPLAESIREFGDDSLDRVARPFAPLNCAASKQVDRPYPDDGLIPIANVGCGHMWVLIVSGSERGNVWAYEAGGDYEPVSGERPDYTGVSTVEGRLAANDRYFGRRIAQALPPQSRWALVKRIVGLS